MKYPLKYKAAVLYKTGFLPSITEVEFRGPLKVRHRLDTDKSRSVLKD